MIDSTQRPEPEGDLLPSPRELRTLHPMGPGARRAVAGTRAAIRAALHGRDERLVVVVGPCSLHDPVGALEYGRALAKLSRDTEDALVVVMRTYFEKPRTTTGWRGLLRDPRLDGHDDLATGLTLARGLLVELGELGLACGAELLEPLFVPYLEDALSWAVIGARTSESQVHRELAAGLGLPIGFKNSVRGELEPAANALVAARAPACFPTVRADGRAGVRRAPGNPDTHLVLRGGPQPNYAPDALARALALVPATGRSRPLMVDCSHGNSGKRHGRQRIAFRSTLAQYAAGRRELLGQMLESYLVPGRQDFRPGTPLVYGQSITDACIGWDETEQLLYEAAAAVRARRS